MSHSLPQSNPNQNSDIDSQSDSDSDSDDMNITEEILNTKPGMKKIYQIQHIKDNQYKFKWVGVFDTIPTVEIDNFKTDKYTCYITNNFTADITNNAIYDLIDFKIIKNNGSIVTVYLSVGFKEINLDGENEGSLMIIMKEGDVDRVILKSNLKYPGNDKLILCVIREFSNEVISKAIDA